MEIQKASSTPKYARGERTREEIKRTALKLYALNGLEGVSAREISRAAGQKNVGSVNYYFSSQDSLISELVHDVASLLDKLHNQKLDELEASGGPNSIRDVVKILIQVPVLDLENSEMDEYSFRFVIMLLLNHRERIFTVMQGYDSGVRRCFAHIRRMMPDLPPALLRQRLMLAFIYVVTTGSAREAAREDPRAMKNLWGASYAQENLADTVVGMITTLPSAETLASLGAPEGTAADGETATAP
jgi:AcrR family transcriptional regulator